MDSRKNYAIVVVDGQIRMVDARLARMAGPFIDNIVKFLDKPWAQVTSGLLGRAASASLAAARAVSCTLPHSRQEIAALTSRLARAFMGRPSERPALLGLIILGLFAAELSVMSLHKYLHLPEYPKGLATFAEQRTPLDRMLDKEVQAFYSSSLGVALTGAKLTPPLPAFIESASCLAERPSALLRIKWPAMKFTVTAEVRRAVRLSAMRMPVDERAFHPRDKQSILRAAGNRLRPVLAAVAVQQNPPTMLAQNRKPAPTPHRKAHRPSIASVAMSGRLSALFESGDQGVYAIGFDPRGGTSYGKYQLSSREGSMAIFLKYIDKYAPHWAGRLRGAGPLNSGYCGGPVAEQWKRIAAENPEKFEFLQDKFVYETYYLPARRKVMDRVGVDVSNRHGALQELLWSTAVQHGVSGGVDIFVRAAHRVRHMDDSSFNKALVEEIFRQRERSFSSSPIQVQSSVQRRLKQEKNMALAMLGKPEPPFALLGNL